LVGDTEYACQALVRGLPERIVFVGPMAMDAALFAPVDPSNKKRGRGRPPKKGARLPSPQQLRDDDSVPWERRTLTLYGKPVDVETKTQRGLWYHVAGTSEVRVIVTRDPKGRIQDRAYFATDAAMSVAELAQTFSYCWSQEEMHHHVKHHLGLQQPHNGWWHRRAGRRRDTTKPGPQPHRSRGELAVKRTVPFILTMYTLIVLWYLDHDTAEQDVERVRRRAPWNRRKKHPS